MKPLNTLLRWLGLEITETELDAWVARQPPPAISFQEIKDVASPPPDEAVEPGVFFRVMRGDKPKWVLFQCPCGCRTVITLSLQLAHRPHWGAHRSKQHRPSLRPSVWRDVGCFSHFVVDDGRVYWCADSGSPP